jgi:hypothetical protein
MFELIFGYRHCFGHTLYSAGSADTEKTALRWVTVGTDFHFGREGVKLRKYKKTIRHFRQMLGALEPQAAERIAYINARAMMDRGRKHLDLIP